LIWGKNLEGFKEEVDLTWTLVEPSRLMRGRHFKQRPGVTLDPGDKRLVERREGTGRSLAYVAETPPELSPVCSEGWPAEQWCLQRSPSA
jgi:hypothetical protein